MGKVMEAVKRHIRNGDVIACDVETDFAVIIAGECSDGQPIWQGCPGEGPGLEPVQPETHLLHEWSLEGTRVRRGPGS